MTKKFLCLTCKFAKSEIPEDIPKAKVAEVKKIPLDKLTDEAYCSFREDLKRGFELGKKVYPTVLYCSKLLFIVVGRKDVSTQVRSECPEYEEIS